MTIKNILQTELNHNEQVLWYGKPKQGLLLRQSDIAQIPFSIAWAGFAFFWEYNAVVNTDDLIFQIFGIPFVLIGIYILIGRFFYDSYQRKFTDYVITNERVIIVNGDDNKTFKSILLKNLTQMELILHKDNYGTIQFGSQDIFNKIVIQSPFLKEITPKFDYVKNINEPYRIIKERINK